MKTRRCHVCKCTESRRCAGHCGQCWWLGEDLCSSCGVLSARHLQKRPSKRCPRKFWWTRHVDIEMGFVRWILRYLIDGRVYGSDFCQNIEEITEFGRAMIAAQLRMIRFHHRIRLAGVRSLTQEKARG